MGTAVEINSNRVTLWPRAALFWFSLALSAASSGLGLMIWGDEAASVPPSGRLKVDPRPLVVEETDARGQSMAVFLLSNLSNEAIRVLGGSRYCEPLACFELEGLPLDIPAHSSKVIRARVFTGGEGTVMAELVLYTNCPQQTQLRIPLAGRIVHRSADR